MASNIPDTDARLRAQEMFTTLLAGQSQTLARDKAERSEIGDLKAAMENGFAALAEQIATSVQAVRTEIQSFREDVDKRFDHVYGELADLNANIRDARNTLSGLVAREGKSPKEK